MVSYLRRRPADDLGAKRVAHPQRRASCRAEFERHVGDRGGLRRARAPARLQVAAQREEAVGGHVEQHSVECVEEERGTPLRQPAARRRALVEEGDGDEAVANEGLEQPRQRLVDLRRGEWVARWWGWHMWSSQTCGAGGREYSACVVVAALVEVAVEAEAVEAEEEAEAEAEVARVAAAAAAGGGGGGGGGGIV